jgi:hypothetical protein
MNNRDGNKRFNFTLGGGSARVELQSFQGDIHVARGALPPRRRNNQADLGDWLGPAVAASIAQFEHPVGALVQEVAHDVEHQVEHHVGRALDGLGEQIEAQVKTQVETQIERHVKGAAKGTRR